MPVLRMNPNLLAGTPLNPGGMRFECNVDPFISKQLKKCRAYIGIFLSSELRPRFQHRHLRAESPHGLRQFEANVAATQNDEMLRKAVKVESFDMCHRLSRRESGDVGHGRARTQSQKNAVG